MKRLLLFSLFTSLLEPQLGFSQVISETEIKDPKSCSGISLSLAKIEKDLMSKRKEGCEDTATKKCQKLEDAVLKYNEAVAKLIILEGLIAISSGVTESANALKNISEKQISRVEKISDQFLLNFDKAKVLNQVLKIEDGKSHVLQGYDGQGIDSLEGYLSVNAKNIYTQIENHPHKKELLEMIHGFSEADHNITTMDRKKDKDYENYAKYLNFEFDKKKVNMDDPTTDKNYQKIVDINNLSKKSKLTDEEKKNLLQMTKSLQDIHLSYSERDNVATNDVTKRIQKDIDIALQSHQSLALALFDVDRQKEKLLGLRTQLSSLQKNSKNGLEQELKSLCEKNNLATGDLKTCFAKLREASPKNDDKSGLNKFEDVFKESRPTPMENLLAEVANCYDKGSLESIKKCQMEVFEKNPDLIKTDIAQARKNLVEAKKEMDSFYLDPSIDELQKQKASLYSLFQSKEECREGETIEKVDLSGGFCHFKELDGLILSSSISGDLDKIVISLEKTYAKEIQDETKKKIQTNHQNHHGRNIADETSQQHKSDDFNSSDGGDNVYHTNRGGEHFVSYGTNDFTVTKEDVKAEKRRIKELKKRNRTGPSGAEYALQGLAQVTVTSAPQLMMLHQQNQYVKSYAENYRQTMIQRQQYQSWLTQQQKYYGQLYATGNMNYGWGFYNPNYASNFNYPNNQYTFYQHGNSGFNFSQYNFLNPMPTPTTGGATTLPASTSTPQFNFQF